MFKAKLVGFMCVSLALFACSPAEMPSRGLSNDFPAVAAPSDRAIAAEAVQAGYNIVGYEVTVPKSLLVSEADVYLPIADIVWHGDPEGDRHAQVKAIFSEAFKAGTADMTSGRAVTVSIEVHKFHALTPKTRATMGGNFAMHFYLSVYDATTQELIDGPRFIVADTRASGGLRALREEAAGLTQKVVIEAKLAEVFREDLQHAVTMHQGPAAISRNAFSPSDLTLAQ